MEINMTPERRAEARARCEAATKGPWRIGCVYGGVYLDHKDENGCDSKENYSKGGWARAVCTTRKSSWRGIIQISNDEKFIAHARKDLPDALDTIDALEAENAELHDRVNVLTERCELAGDEIDRLRAELESLRGQGESAVNGRV